MNENKLYMYRKPIRNPNPSTENKITLSSQNLSEENSQKRSQNLRSKKNNTELLQEYGSIQHNSSINLFSKLNEVVNLSSASNHLYHIDKSFQFEPDITPLKFYLNYHYRSQLNDTDSDLMQIPMTTRETSYTNNSSNKLSNSVKFDDERAKTSRERVISPHAARLTPLSKGVEKTNKMDSLENIKRPAVAERKPMMKKSLVKTIASAELQNQSLDNTQLRLRKTETVLNTEKLYSKITGGRTRKIFRNIEKENPFFQTEQSVSIGNSIIEPPNRAVTPSAQRKNFFLKKFSANAIKRIAGNLSPKSETGPEIQRIELKETVHEHDKNLKISSLASEDMLQGNKPTAASLYMQTPADQTQLNINNSSTFDQRTAAITETKVMEVELENKNNLQQLQVIVGATSHKSQQQSYLASADCKQPKLPEPERKECKINLQPSESNKQSLSSTRETISETATKQLISATELEIGRSNTNVDPHSLISVNTASDDPRPRPKLANPSANPERKTSPKPEAAKQKSKFRANYQAKQSPHSFQFNFNKRTSMALPSTEEHSDWSEATSTKGIDVYDSPKPQRYFWQKKKQSTSTLEDTKTPVDEVWNKNFNAYKHLVETKLDAIYQFHVKEVITSTAFQRSTQNILSEGETDINDINSRPEDTLATEFAKEHDRLLGRGGVGLETFQDFVTARAASPKATDSKLRVYKINVIPPITEAASDHEHSLDKIVETHETQQAQDDHKDKYKNKDTEKDKNATQVPKNGEIPTKPLNKKIFEFFTGVFVHLDNSEHFYSSTEWDELEKLEMDTLEETKSDFDVFRPTSDMKSYTSFRVELCCELLYKTMAYLLRKTTTRFSWTFETNIELGEMRTGDSTFIFTPKFERYTAHVVQLPEDIAFLFELVGELPEKLISAIPGYNENRLGAENDENKFNEIDLLRFNDGEIVEPILAFSSTAHSSRKSALILTRIEGDNRLHFLTRNTKPVAFDVEDIDLTSKQKALLERITSLERDPSTLNSRYIANLFERSGKSNFLGLFESEIELKEPLNKEKKSSEPDENVRPAFARRTAAKSNAVQLISRLAASKKENLKRRSQTQTDRDSRNIKRALTKANMKKQGTEVIDEVEEEVHDKNQLIVKGAGENQNIQKALTTPGELGEMLKSPVNNKEHPSMQETEKIERYQKKQTSSASETISQIHKKNTESDNLNWLPTRMFTNSSVHSIEKAIVGSSTNIGGNLEQQNTNNVMIPNIHLLGVEVPTKQARSRKDDLSPEVSNENTPHNNPLAFRAASFQKRATVLQVPQSDEKKPRRDKSRESTLIVPPFDPNNGRRDKKRMTLVTLPSEQSFSKRRLTLNSEVITPRERHSIISNVVQMSSKAAIKRASLKNKEIYDPITQMFSYITENRTVEFSGIFKNSSIQGNLKDRNGDTMLSLATKMGNMEMVKLILSKAPDINSQNNEGNTALHIALQSNYMEIADRLIVAGARQDIRNYHGKTPWECAS